MSPAIISATIIAGGPEESPLGTHMYQILEEVPKTLSALGTSVGSTWKLIKDVQGHFALRKEISEKSGQQGVLFFLCYTLFQYIYQIGLVFIGLAGFAALLGGGIKALGVAWAPSQLVFLYEHYSIKLVICAILWSAVSFLNALSWITILLLSLVPPHWFSFRQSAGWHNLKQFVLPLQSPKPLFLNKEGIEQLADGVVLRLMSAAAGASNFADKPKQLTRDELANTALFGCLIEKEYSVQKWERRDWAPFYAAMADARVGAERIFSPTFLADHAPNIDFYGAIRQAVNQQFPEGPDLPDSPVVMDHLSKAVGILVAEYKGSARNLPFAWWGMKPNIKRAFARAQSFLPLDRESMVPQFLKLAVRWDVWPDIDAGNFIYPYAKTLALLVLERHALITLDRADRFAFRDIGELYAFREAMRRTAKSVEDILSDSNRAEHRAYLRELNSAGHPIEWELAADVDFALWSWSTEIKKANGFTQWRIDNDGMIARNK